MLKMQLATIRDVEKATDKGKKEDDRKGQKRERPDHQTSNWVNGKTKKLLEQ